MKKLLIHPEELSREWVDRLVLQGVEILGLHPVGGNSAAESARRLMTQVEDPHFRELIDYAWEKGLQVEYELHAASFLLPRELFESHPEYFRLENGQRNPLCNFCVSNSEALEILTDNAVAFAKKLYRSRPYYYFWLDDTRAKYCSCPECQTLSMSDQQMLVMNAMVKKLRAAIPAAKLCFLAYHGTETPPTQIRPEEGIFLEYAPMNRDFGAPAEAVSQEAKENIAKLIGYFGTEDATVLEYWYDNSMFSKWTKPPKAFTPRNDLIPGDLRWYESLGFEHIASFACYLGEDYVNLHGQPDISAFR
jgi:hypothetical protein